MILAVPAHTNRAHLEQRNPLCDTARVLNMAMVRGHSADMNAVSGREHDWNLHWPDGPGKNHFTHIIDAHTGKRRPMTHAELHRHVALWPSEAIFRWRKRVGRGRWVRPFTVAQRNAQARRRRVRICWELKSPAYGTNPALAVRFVAAINATRWPSFYMTLVTMKNWRGKMRYFSQAGGGTALLAHGAPRPADLAQWSPYINRVWGRFH